MADEEDVIVEEIPVFLSKALKDNIYIFQYPTKTNHNTFNNTRVVNCCVKPINREVKIDFCLDTDSDFYDSFKGEQLAMAADGKNQSKNERPTFKYGLMDKHSYRSTKSRDNIDEYVLGVLQDGEVHLSPISSILQLHPSFSYFDKQDKRAKAEQKAAKDGENDDEELQQITVKFSRSDADRFKKTKTNINSSDQQPKSVDEPWCETMWYPAKSSVSELEKQKLFAAQNQPSGDTLSLDGAQYLQKMDIISKNAIKLEEIPLTKVLSRMDLKGMPLLDQIKRILIDAKMITLSRLMSLLEDGDSDTNPEKVLRTLPSIAVFLRGNLVIQSEVLYPSESLSNFNGVSADLMVQGRDYVIYQLTKQESLSRQQVMLSTQLPQEEVLEILQSVARLNTEKHWEPILPPDTLFEARNFEFVQRQEMVWKARENFFNEMHSERWPKRIRKRSHRDSKTERPSTSSGY